MSLSQKIAAALDAGAPPCAVTAEDGPYRLTLQLTAAGPVGLEFSALEFATRARPAWSPDELSAWGDRVAARVTYLMEPLVVLEQDRDGGAVALRSRTPTERASRRAFYEVLLRREGTLTLTRSAFAEETRQRQPVPCQMTREVIERLADDLAATAG